MLVFSMYKNILFPHQLKSPLQRGEMTSKRLRFERGYVNFYVNPGQTAIVK